MIRHSLLIILYLAFWLTEGTSNGACEVRAPRFLSVKERSSLCSLSAKYGDAPADCAKTVKLKLQSQRYVAVLLELCTTASSIGPAVCFNLLNPISSLTMETKIQLCSDARTAAPAECARVVLDVVQSKRLSNENVVFACQGFERNATLVHECLVATPRSVSKETQLRLCKNARSMHSVDCFATLNKKKYSPKLAARICAEATSSEPARCALELRGKWSDDEKVQLCRGVTSLASIQCVSAIKSVSFKNPDRVAICTGAQSVGRADCINAASGKLSNVEKIRLCNGAQSTIPAECFAKIQSNIETLLKITLCEHTTSVQPALCFNRANRDLSDKQKVELCRNAVSDYPNRCLGTIRATRVPSDLKIALCHGATTVAPAECFNHLPFGVSQDYGVLLCRHATSALPSECARDAPHNFTQHDKVTLCTGAESVKPAECARQYIGKVDRDVLIELCQHAPSKAPVLCFRAAPMAMKARLKVKLCAQANDTLPALCVNTISPAVHDAFRVNACQGATSLTPAYCAMHTHLNKLDLTNEGAEYCRTAVVAPTSLEISRLEYLCPVLLPHCPVKVTLLIMDQVRVESIVLAH